MRLYHPEHGFLESDRSTDIANLLASGWSEVVAKEPKEIKQPDPIDVTDKIFNTRKQRSN